GIEVFGMDVDERIVADLQSGARTSPEPEVNALVERGLALGRLHVDSAVRQAEAYVVCVPTPIRADRTADLSFVDAAMQSISPLVRSGDLIVIESTVPIGTVAGLVAPILRDCGLDPLVDIDMCYCPERVFPGNTISEMTSNSRVVGGLTPRAGARGADLYRSFCRGEITVTTAPVAEFSKLMENTFRDVNIALANVFAAIAEQAGIDFVEVSAI